MEAEFKSNTLFEYVEPHYKFDLKIVLFFTAAFKFLNNNLAQDKRANGYSAQSIQCISQQLQCDIQRQYLIIFHISQRQQITAFSVHLIFPLMERNTESGLISVYR